MDIPLTGGDILKALKNKIDIVGYQDLQYYNNINELLSPYGAVVVLYPFKANIGHWVCVFYSVNRDGNMAIEFFDPYGLKVDSEFKYIDGYSGPNYMARLLYHSSLPIEYNNTKLQQMKEGIDTCGRHVIVRLWEKDKYIDDYVKELKSIKGLTPDEIVTLLTINYGKK